MANCETIWSNAGYTNPSNWISHTDWYPRKARPIAVPTMPDSANGVDDSTLTEVLSQTIGHPKHPAESADVLPHHHDLRVASIAARRPLLMACAKLITIM